MSLISSELRAQVVARAGGRCEYCQLDHESQVATYPIDHVIPVALGGKTEINNLALSCPGCNSGKWTRVEAPDPPDRRADAPLQPSQPGMEGAFPLVFRSYDDRAVDCCWENDRGSAEPEFRAAEGHPPMAARNGPSSTIARGVLFAARDTWLLFHERLEADKPHPPRTPPIPRPPGRRPSREPHSSLAAFTTYIRSARAGISDLGR